MSDKLDTNCVQGFYCSRINKGYVGFKRPLWDRFLLFLGVDKRASTWKVVQQKAQIKTYERVGTGILNAGKDYGKVEVYGLVIIERNGLMHERAYFVSSEGREPIDIEFAKHILKD